MGSFSGFNSFKGHRPDHWPWNLEYLQHQIYLYREMEFTFSAKSSDVGGDFALWNENVLHKIHTSH
jgi:hypothetical protein